MPNYRELELRTPELRFQTPVLGGGVLSAGPLSPVSVGSGTGTLESRKRRRFLGPANVLPATALLWARFEGCNP